VIQLNPKYLNAYKKRGEILEIKGELSQALLDFRSFVRLNPNDLDGSKAIQRIENKINAKK
jgi:tetratricopeptide (TPR) repeat protein